MKNLMPAPVSLDAPLALGAPLADDQRAALAAFRKRAALESSAAWRTLGPEATRAAAALAYGRPARPAPRPARRFLRVATWNVQRGLRLDGLLGTLRTSPLLQDLDALLLNEVDVGMARSGNRDVAREIAEALGFEYVFGNSYLCLCHGNARDGAPGAQNEAGLHGNAILSRWPLTRAQNVDLYVTRDKFQSSEKRLGAKRALWAEADTPLGRVLLASAHLDSVASTEQRRRQLVDLLAAIDAARADAVLLGGDLNTHTYDVSGTGGLLANLWRKLTRGGFPHGVYHYMHPWELYDAPVFAALEGAGLDWRSFNDLSRGSLRYEVGSFDSESSVRDHLPGAAVRLLRWKLQPWNGVCPLRMDWFAGRGLRALAAGELGDEGRTSRAPTTLEKPTFAGQRISDHDPLLVDVVPDAGSAAAGVRGASADEGEPSVQRRAG